MKPNAVMHKLIDLVEAVVFEGDADDQFVDIAVALLALAIARLPQKNGRQSFELSKKAAP
jgi:hypothetical protein